MSTGNDKESSGHLSMASSTSNADVPVIPEMTNSKDFAASNFSQVIFPDISDYFPPGKDVKVAYVLTEALEPSSRDWIGLFQVGWTSAREYITFVWAPKLDSSNKDRTVYATFSAYYLPTDKNEFYQFCYVTKQGHVRGASTPFQFRNQMECDQLVEVEDETGMIVLKTKTAAMEEQLDKITTEKVKLDARLAELNKEKSGLESELSGVKTELKSVQETGDKHLEQCQKLEAEVKDLTEKLEKVTTEIHSANTRMSRQKTELNNAAFAIAKLTKETLGMREKLEKSVEEHEKQMSSLNGQLDSKTEKLAEAECAVVELTDKLKKMEMQTNDLQQKALTATTESQQSVSSLKKERDDARVKADRYKEEKDLFKDQFTRSEEARREIMVQMAELKKKIAHKEDEVRQKGEKIQAYEEKTKILKKELKDSTKQSTVQKSAMESQLSNVEDKLNACEASKRLIAIELTEARDFRDKLMSELNQAKKEKDQLTRELAAVERQRTEMEKNFFSMKERAERGEQRIVEKENKLVEEKARAKRQEKELRDQISILHHQLESADEAVAAATSAEQNKTECSTQTKSTKVKPAHASSQTKENIKANENVIDDLKMQIEDLRTRLSMGAAAYTEKYMECHKLERKMKKIQGQKTVPKVVAGVQKASLPESTSDSQEDVNQTRKVVIAAAGKTKKTSTSEAGSSSNKTQPEDAVTEEASTRGNFMSKLEQLFMAIADPDAEEQEQANQLRIKLQDLEKSVQFQHSKYRKYKQLYQEEKTSRASECEKANDELLTLKVEVERLKASKEILENENKALKEQIDEFVKNSHDENVIKTRRPQDIAPPVVSSIGCRYGNPYKQEGNQARSGNEEGVKPILKLLYGNPYKSEPGIITRDANSSDSDFSGDFQMANSGFPALGLCPKNQSSEDSDPIEINRPPVENSPAGNTVINRQPIRSPPLIEIISDDTTSDDLSSPSSYDHDAATAAYNSRNSTPAAPSGSAEKASATRRRRTGKGRKTKSRKSYA